MRNKQWNRSGLNNRCCCRVPAANSMKVRTGAVYEGPGTEGQQKYKLLAKSHRMNLIDHELESWARHVSLLRLRFYGSRAWNSGLDPLGLLRDLRARKDYINIDWHDSHSGNTMEIPNCNITTFLTSSLMQLSTILVIRNIFNTIWEDPNLWLRAQGPSGIQNLKHLKCMWLHVFQMISTFVWFALLFVR